MSLCIFLNTLLSKEFSMEAYSKTIRERVKVADNFIYENIETRGQWKDTQGAVWFIFVMAILLAKKV